jgi:hypothetical protein
MPKPMRRKSRLRANANCMRYSLLAGIGLRRQLAESPAVAWTILALPPGLLLYLRDRNWLRHNRELVEAWSP